MKNKKFVEEISNLSTDKLQEKLDQMRRDLFSLKLNAQTGHVKDNSQFTLMRRNIARVQTMLREQELKQNG